MGRNRISRYLVLLATLVLFVTFMSCNEDVPGGDADKMMVDISASVANDNWNDDSRTVKDTDGISILSFENNDKIVVDAWYFPRVKNGVDPSAPNFMQQQEMSYVSENGTWAYSPIKYWPNDKLIFFAYHLAGSRWCTISYDDPESDYPTFTFDYRDVFDGDWANDILVAPITTVNRNELVDGKAPLQFRHIMSKVKMYVRYLHEDGTDDKDEMIYLNRVNLYGYPGYAKFKGFNESLEPIWEVIELKGGVIYDDTGYAIKAGEEYTELPGFTHFNYPWRTYNPNTGNYVSNFSFEATNINGDPFIGIAYGEPIYADIDFKAGYITSIYVTINSTGIKVDSDSGPIDWSGTNNQIVVTTSLKLDR